MSFEVPEPRATLVLTDPPYAGAEIDAAVSLSPAVYYATKQWLDQMRAADDNGGVVDAMAEVSALFVAHARPTWNLTRDGVDIPASVEGMLSLGVELITQIVLTWSGTIGTVPVPLPEAPLPGKASGATRTTRRSRSTATSRTGASRRALSIARTPDSSDESGAA